MPEWQSDRNDMYFFHKSNFKKNLLREGRDFLENMSDYLDFLLVQPLASLPVL